MNVRLFRPSVGEEELENIRQVFERAWLGLGPCVSEFEKKWSQYIGAANSIGVNSGTAALHLALTAFNFPQGKKVLVPALTFVSSATAAMYNGLVPVFVDIDMDTLSMDMDDLKKKITPDCVAVVAVHFGGHPVAMDKLIEIAKEHNLAVIEDCAHCAGGEYKGKKLGTWGDIGCFSFEEKKSMTTGDGGMIVSNQADLIEPLRAYRWVGIDKDTWKRESTQALEHNNDAMHWYYEIGVLGYKFNMNDLMAAVGLAQLEKLDAMNAHRRHCISRYLEGISKCKTLSPILPYELENSSYWIFGLRAQRRDELIIHLKKKNIATGVHYMPLPMHPLFKDNKDEIPVAREIWKTFLTLPLHAALSDEEIDYVTEALCEFAQA